MNAQTTAPEPSSTQIVGQWRIVLIGLWLVVVTATVGVYLFGIPLQYRLLEGIAEYQAADTVPGGTTARFAAAFDVALDLVTTALYVGVGLFIFWRKPDDRITLFTSLMLATFGTVVATGIPRAVAEYYPATVLLVRMLEAIGNLSLIIFVLTLPNGFFYPRWSRWVAWGYGALVFVSVFLPTELLSPGSPSNAARFVFLMAIYLLGAAITVYRFRTYLSPEQVQQAKWIFYGMLILLAGFVFLFTSNQLQGALIGEQLTLAEMAEQTVLALALFAVPVTFGIAILRFRLWDINFVLSRSLIYASLTVLLIGVLVSAFFGLRLGLEVAIGGSQAAPAGVLAILLVIVTYRPARHLLIGWVDRQLFDIQIDYERRVEPEAIVPLPVPEAVPSLQPELFGQMELIGAGGMAEIYKAQLPQNGDQVAVKVLPLHMAANKSVALRFAQEADITARLSHPNIVRVFTAGHIERRSYIVMEYIHGQPLVDILAREGALSLERSLPILAQVAAALDYAHSQGVVHRDVKPGNVMIEEAKEGGLPRAVLMDFGIARDAGLPALPAQGEMVGSFTYIAPEQIRDSAVVDGRADIYALGVMAFHMLAGYPPFDRHNTAAMLIAHMTQPPPELHRLNPRIPAAASDVIRKALAKNPAERFGSAGAFVKALAAAREPASA